jgi:hypothetical protein
MLATAVFNSIYWIFAEVFFCLLCSTFLSGLKDDRFILVAAFGFFTARVINLRIFVFSYVGI